MYILQLWSPRVGLLTVGTGVVPDSFASFWDFTPPYCVTLPSLNTWEGVIVLLHLDIPVLLIL